MALARYQHMSIFELILLIKQHILVLCKKICCGCCFDNNKLDMSNISYCYRKGVINKRGERKGELVKGCMRMRGGGKTRGGKRKLRYSKRNE